MEPMWQSTSFHHWRVFLKLFMVDILWCHGYMFLQCLLLHSYRNIEWWIIIYNRWRTNILADNRMISLISSAGWKECRGILPPGFEPSAAFSWCVRHQPRLNRVGRESTLLPPRPGCETYLICRYTYSYTISLLYFPNEGKDRSQCSNAQWRFDYPWSF
jgi:hypothetical protein